MGLQTSSHNILHSKNGNNSDAWQHKQPKTILPKVDPNKVKRSTYLTWTIESGLSTWNPFLDCPKIPSTTRLAKDLVDKICHILQYLVEHVTYMYLTPSLYVKNKGSTRSETTQPNWNGGFSCCKEPAVELHLPPRIPPLQPPPRRKGRRGVPPGARPFGPKMGTPGVAVGSMEKLRWKKIGVLPKKAWAKHPQKAHEILKPKIVFHVSATCSSYM